MGKNLVRDIIVNKNIEININNGNGYDVLYPKTTLENVVNWTNSIYSKSQTYSRSETYSKAEVNNLLAGAGGNKIIYGSYTCATEDGEVQIPLEYPNPRFMLLGLYTNRGTFSTSSPVDVNLGGEALLNLTNNVEANKFERVVICGGNYDLSNSNTALVKTEIRFYKAASLLTLKSTGAGRKIIYVNNSTLKASSNFYKNPFFQPNYSVCYALLY